MVLQAVQPVFNPAGDSTDHRANQVMFFERREIGDIKKLNRMQPHLLAGFAEVFERNFRITPFANRMVDSAFDSRPCRFIGSSEPFGKRCCSGNGDAGCGDSCESIPAGDLRLHKQFLGHSRNTPVSSGRQTAFGPVWRKSTGEIRWSPVSSGALRTARPAMRYVKWPLVATSFLVGFAFGFGTFPLRN